MNAPAGRIIVLDTPCTVTGTEGFIAEVQQLARRETGATCVDFTNVHIVAQRRVDPEFRRITDTMDYFVPDSQVLVWAVRLLGGKAASRAYGPVFLRECVRATPAPFTHYFLGGSAECVEKVQHALKALQPGLQIVGAHHGYFDASEEARIVEEINRLRPDFIWVGLGTPRQQDWMHRHRGAIRRGVILAVGFAFDVNAGTKPDAPAWLRDSGFTWLYRLCREPRRLLWRYVKYNTIFLWFLLGQWLRCVFRRG